MDPSCQIRTENVNSSGLLVIKVTNKRNPVIIQQLYICYSDLSGFSLPDVPIEFIKRGLVWKDKHGSLKIWARDEESAKELAYKCGVKFNKDNQIKIKYIGDQ